MTKRMNPDVILSERLEDLEALRESAASLERLRGVIMVRFRQHENAQVVADYCHTLAQRHIAEFDRRMVFLLDMAWVEDVDSEENHDA